MARVDVLTEIYSKKRLIKDFDFDGLSHAPISFYLTYDDIKRLNYFATSVKWSSKSKKEKFAEIDKILYPRGFERFHSGTNRLVYKNIYDQSFLIKIAIDAVGLSDNPDEYYIQNLVKPFVTKIFDVTPCGTVSMVERVNPISNRYQFEDVAGTIFDILHNFFIGKYILEDIGSDFFMNWGIRDGFGPVILDFPYIYETDGEKLYCVNIVPGQGKCTGMIDYDAGLNTLVCEHCGKRYTARSLSKTHSTSIKAKIIEEVSNMEREILVGVIKDGKEYKLYNESDCIAPRRNSKPKRRCSEDDIVVIVKGGYKAPVEQPKETVVVKEKVTETVTVTQTVATTMAVPTEEWVEEVEVLPPTFEQDNSGNSVLVDQDPEVEKNFAEEAKREQQELEEKEVLAKTSNQPTAKERTQINQFMIDQMKKFPFGNYDSANNRQHNDIVDYLVTSVSSKYPIEPGIMVMIVEEFVNEKYEFEDDSLAKAEVLAQQHFGNDSYEEEETFQPIKRTVAKEF